MKFSTSDYQKLKDALQDTLDHWRIPYSKVKTMRDRWDTLWEAQRLGFINVSDFYKKGYNDNHIDSALRKAFRKG